jgi:hypothetical protein
MILTSNIIWNSPFYHTEAEQISCPPIGDNISASTSGDINAREGALLLTWYWALWALSPSTRCSDNEQNLLFLPGIDTRISSSPAYRTFTIMTELCRFIAVSSFAVNCVLNMTYRLAFGLSINDPISQKRLHKVVEVFHPARLNLCIGHSDSFWVRGYLS